MGRVRKLIPITESSNHECKHLEFENLEFIPVILSEIRTMCFELRSNSGSLVEFNDSKFSDVYIDLVFRRTPLTLL